MKLIFRTISACAVVVAPLTGMSCAAFAHAQCPLAAAGNPLKHIVFLEFDNLHLERDALNVPSDLEQMPHLFQFLTGHGLLSANHHSVQIFHTAKGFLTAIWFANSAHELMSVYIVKCVWVRPDTPSFTICFASIRA
jgi:hypothetical protein